MNKKKRNIFITFLWAVIISLECHLFAFASDYGPSAVRILYTYINDDKIVSTVFFLLAPPEMRRQKKQ